MIYMYMNDRYNYMKKEKKNSRNVVIVVVLIVQYVYYSFERFFLEPKS